MSLKDILLQSKKAISKGCSKETIKTTGCTGNCQNFTKNNLPDCENCHQFKKENENSSKLISLICTWISVMDNHTCQRCSELNGKTMTGQEALAYQKEVYDLHAKGKDKCRCLIKWSGK